MVRWFCYLTVISPVIVAGWISQKYLYVPGWAKVWVYCFPVAISPEANMPSGCSVTPLAPCATVPEVIVCTPGSIWFQVTVVPAVTVMVAGRYAINLMSTVSLVGVFAAGFAAVVGLAVEPPEDPHAVIASGARRAVPMARRRRQVVGREDVEFGCMVGYTERLGGTDGLHPEKCPGSRSGRTRPASP